MSNQIPPIDWYARPDSWTYRMPGFSPFPGSWRVPTPPLAASDTRNQSDPIDYSADEPSSRGILGQFSKPIEPPESPSAWNATFSMPRQLNTEPVNFLPAEHPAFRIQLPSHVEPMPPTVPFYRADGSRVDPIEAAWQPPEPPKDWRTRMREALSDKNIRYYAGPGFSQFLENLAGLVPMLPGSGMVESQQDAREARNDFKSGNYGKAAAHLASGTANVGLDGCPAEKRSCRSWAGWGPGRFLGLCVRLPKRWKEPANQSMRFGALPASGAMRLGSGASRYQTTVIE
jgi:hypothetical protein